VRAIIQRVNGAALYTGDKLITEIKKGIVAFVAFTHGDNDNSMEYMFNKIAGLRIFTDGEGKMNLSVSDITGDILFVPNFTLYGDARKGFRPNYTASAPFAEAEKMFGGFKSIADKYQGNINIRCGIFGADMKITVENDGPVNLLLDSERMF
jgi:D-tyrosyl-tRNA(Tyr) deacylase